MPPTDVCEPSIEALNFGVGGLGRGVRQGRCECRSDVFVKFKYIYIYIFFFFFFFFFWGGGGGGRVGGSGWM